MAILDEFIELRILVAALGEKNNAGWWESSFLKETGVRYLAYAFPRAPEIAAIQGAVEAARRVHDARIGASGVTHLFRQSYEVELLILDYLKGNIRSIHDRMSSIYSKPYECEISLRAMAAAPESGHEGPVQIGTVNGLPEENALKRMAAIYLGALGGGTCALPYFLSSI
ncbi:MAG TPA: BrxE family protein [Spirochaetia bacterium]|nr:BrxE family protein [Spirochaetia bacterium]